MTPVAVTPGNARYNGFREFNMECDDWEVWMERLQQYFIANDVPDTKKASILLTLLGNNEYMLLRDLATPKKPSKLGVEDINKILSTHLKPKPSEVIERYKFKERKQLSGESIKDYVAILKKMSLLVILKILKITYETS